MMYLWLLWENLKAGRQEGQGLVEYALIIALIAILLIVALLAVGDQISMTFNTIVSGLAQ